MESPTCRGCIRARYEEGYAVPGAPACLGCARVTPGQPDRWTPRPPGGTPATCDERGVSFRSPLPDGWRGAGLGAAALLGSLALASGGLSALLLAAAALCLVALALHLDARGVRHSLGIRGEQVWHEVMVGGIALRRAYPAAAIRAFYCAGSRANGPVGFHQGCYTVRVTSLPAPGDNEWLTRQLNDRLKASRRRTTRQPPGRSPLGSAQGG